MSFVVQFVFANDHTHHVVYILCTFCAGVCAGKTIYMFNPVQTTGNFRCYDAKMSLTFSQADYSIARYEELCVL